MSSNRNLLKENEVAERLGISLLTIRKWRVFGRGPRYRKLGGRAVRYHPDDIERWITEQPEGGETVEVAR